MVRLAGTGGVEKISQIEVDNDGLTYYISSDFNLTVQSGVNILTGFPSADEASGVGSAGERLESER
jgi:hypothetical protein